MNPKVALITGGGGGVGRATARRLVEAGYAVALLGRDPDALADAARPFGEKALAATADVTSRPEVEAALLGIGDRLGPPLVLVNAAGVAESSPLLPPDDDLWRRTIEVNATGAWIVTTACLPAMRLAGFGRIVNVASTAALRGYRFTAAYVASKHALLGLTRALAEDLRGTGVTVNAVCPGFLDTPMTARTVERIVEATGCSADEARQKLAAANASGRLIAPDEVAHAIVELVGDPEAHGEARVLG